MAYVFCLIFVLFFSLTFHITSGWRGYSFHHPSLSFVTYSLSGLSYAVSLLPSFLQYLNCIFYLHLWLFRLYGGLVSCGGFGITVRNEILYGLYKSKFLWGLGRFWGVTHLAYYFFLILSISLVGFPLFHLHGNSGFCFLASVSVEQCRYVCSIIFFCPFCFSLLLFIIFYLFV